jgi:hypothetical protein
MNYQNNNIQASFYIVNYLLHKNTNIPKVLLIIAKIITTILQTSYQL